MASARSLEVKVGLLILAAMVLLAAFILVMGGINFQPTYELSVGFDNPGGLQSGAPVKIAGVKVGKVKQIDFSGGQTDPKSGAPLPLVHARISLEKRFQPSIHDNATFYITTQGVLGEQFLAVDPGSNDRPALDSGASIRGLDPPRLDRLIAESYDLLHTMVGALREHKPQLKGVFEGLAKTLNGTGTFFDRNADKIDRIADNVVKMSDDGVALVQGAKTKYVENSQIDRIMQHAEAITGAGARAVPPLLEKDVPALLEKTNATVDGANKVVSLLSSPDELARIKNTLANVEATSQSAKVAVADAQAIAAHIKKGKGTVGAIVMDEQLFDDLQELARDLKHNPWKFFWKE
ncbi:MAG: MCE family protein [Deltaproteobacteria bacterium]|nr:MCE family protein [Deltaproteobacteria bacterium]